MSVNREVLETDGTPHFNQPSNSLSINQNHVGVKEILIPSAMNTLTPIHASFMFAHSPKIPRMSTTTSPKIHVNENTKQHNVVIDKGIENQRMK